MAEQASPAPANVAEAITGVAAEAPTTPLQVKEADETPQAESAPLIAPQAEPENRPAAFGEELDGVPQEPAVARAEVSAPQELMQMADAQVEEAAPAATAEVEAPKVSAPEAPVEAPVKAKAEAEAQVEAQVEAPIEAPAEAIASSAPVVETAPVQTTMQTTMQADTTMSGGSYDQDQLDIPAFLRR